jgi:hypothetical protein
MLTDAEINERVGVLLRRQIEARVVAPIVAAFAAEFGRERTLEILGDTIKEIARQQGREIARRAGTNDIAGLVARQAAWRMDDALRTTTLTHTDEQFDYNVTRCRYAEMYKELDMPELGFLLSCNRDFAFGEGFNPDLELTRTQTIMQGASYCDFRYRMKAATADAAAESGGE